MSMEESHIEPEAHPEQHLFAIPYTIMLRKAEEGDWIAKIQELNGCMTHGATLDEALTNLEEVRCLWLQVALEEGVSIPPPNSEW